VLIFFQRKKKSKVGELNRIDLNFIVFCIFLGIESGKEEKETRKKKGRSFVRIE
jgi:hypothetical protein